MNLIEAIKNPGLPREGDNIVKLTNDMDYSITAFHVAWAHVNYKAGGVIIPKNIYLNMLDLNSPQFVGPVLHGSFKMILTDNEYEWWMDFEDSDLIFYSPGA